MKRKGAAAVQDESTRLETVGKRHEAQDSGPQGYAVGQTFLLDEGRLRPISPSDYTTATLYQVVESYEVECRLVRPEEPGALVFDGKRPSKKTVPIVISRSGESTVLESWDALESRPEMLAEAAEVVGAAPVRQVFVLKRR